MSRIIETELSNLFGITDLMLIVGFKSKEAFQNSSTDLITMRQCYLRAVIKSHPNTSGLTTDTEDGVKEYYVRTKRLFVMEDIFKFLTGNEDGGRRLEREKYFQDGILPDLPSLKFLREKPFKGEFTDFQIPEFEEIAAELKSLFQTQMGRIKRMQEEALVD